MNNTKFTLKILFVLLLFCLFASIYVFYIKGMMFGDTNEAEAGQIEIVSIPEGYGLESSDIDSLKNIITEFLNKEGYSGTDTIKVTLQNPQYDGEGIVVDAVVDNTGDIVQLKYKDGQYVQYIGDENAEVQR